MTTGEKIRLTRKAAGMTQIDLAKRLKVSQGRISEWEAGKRGLSVERLKRIARVLNVAPGELL